MYSKTLFLFCVFLSSLFASVFAAGSTNTIKIEKAADWIIEREVNLPDSLPLDAIEGGVYYTLIDYQIRVVEGKDPVFFSHYAELIVNQQGLDTSSQINVEYDPIYEKLTFNTLYIHRDGKVIDKLVSARMSVIQRETEMEKQLYDGRLTANVILDDVRVGDVVEYSYTLEGENPVYKNIFAHNSYIEWSVPIHQQKIRVLWGKHAPLYVTTLNSNVEVKERQFGSFREYYLEVNDGASLNINTEVPDWYIPYGMVFFSESKSWSEIALWALPLYENAIETGPDIKNIADAIRAEYKDPELQIVQALKYVQSEIRYLGIETGSNSHTPTSAKETLQRRYGDCKDKAVLFVSLLKLLGIQAKPALVNSKISRQIADFPPTVNAFNHVLVKVWYSDEIFWLDPTRQYQEGRLKNIYQPDYGYALVVSQGENSLERMRYKPGSAKLIIKDKFDLTLGGGKDVVLESITQSFGYDAENLRYQIANEGLTGLHDKYLEFYGRNYSAVESMNKLDISEDKATGAILQKEKYLLKKFWETNTEDKEYDGFFYAGSIRPYFSKPKQINRNSPYKIAYPINIKHTIDINIWTRWLGI